MSDEASWSTFVVVMGRALRALDDDQVIGMEPRGSERYVQILRYGDRVRAEVASNAFLQVREHWSPEQEHVLRELGWNAPGGGQHQGPNWHLDLGVDWIDDVVELLANTFRRVHGLEAPTTLEVAAPTGTVSNGPDPR